MSDSIKLIFKKLDKSFKYHQNDMKINQWQTNCLLNLANQLGVKITEKGDVFSRKSNLRAETECFHPKSEVFLAQLASKVEILSELVENLDLKKKV